jgi:hypothetical protein
MWFVPVLVDCQLSLHGGHVDVPQSRTWACELDRARARGQEGHVGVPPGVARGRAN